MNKVDELDVVAQIALLTYPFVVALLLGFLRSAFKDMREQIATEKLARIAQGDGLKRLIEAEALARGAALTSIRAELQRTDDRVLSLQREIDKDYVNYDRLMHALRPISESLVDIKREQDRLFERLDGKVDKDGHPQRRKQDVTT